MIFWRIECVRYDLFLYEDPLLLLTISLSPDNDLSGVLIVILETCLLLCEARTIPLPTPDFFDPFIGISIKTLSS